MNPIPGRSRRVADGIGGLNNCHGFGYSAIALPPQHVTNAEDMDA